MTLRMTFADEYGVPMSAGYRALVDQLKPPVEDSFMTVYSDEFQRTHDWVFRCAAW